MIKRIFLLTTILGLCTYSIYAQKIKGTVFEKGTKDLIGLPGANVYWTGTNKGVVTDIDGKFEIDWNDEGVLVASFIGYKSDTLKLSQQNQTVKFILAQGEMMKQVDVVGRGKSTMMGSGPMQEEILTGEELCKAACCNLGESFTTNASVDVSYSDAVTGAKQIQLLGLAGKYVQMMTENIPNFRGASALYGLSYVPGAWMNAISVSKGIGSVLKGYEAIAGQVSVDYKKPLQDKFFINGITSTDGGYEINTDFGFRLSNNWSTSFLIHGDWMDKNHDANHDTFLDAPRKNQYNIMNRWAYMTPDWSIQFGGKYLQERRIGGQVGVSNSYKPENADSLFGINIDTKRYEVFSKFGLLMPQYDNTSMALILNYVNHDQQSGYGRRAYNSKQETFYANYIYQSIFGTNINQKYSAGLSFNYDHYDDYLNDLLFTQGASSTPAPTKQDARWNRHESVGGIFFEYTGHFIDQFTLMAGIRYDYNSRYHGLFTPRLHFMYTPTERTTFKLSAGRGYRTANVLAENASLFATNKRVYILDKLLVENPDMFSDLKLEKAWNFGFSFNQKFTLGERMGSFTMDYFRTEFQNQVIVDDESVSNRIRFYNLDGSSYANCYQAELRYELFNRMDFLTAFRFNDTHYTLDNGKKVRTPLQSKYKGIINLSYYTNMKKWQFDFTTQFNGGGRIPESTTSDKDNILSSHFNSYQLMNAQITKFFRNWSIYTGCENIADFTQKNPINCADEPWNANFDATKIWGPIHGRKFYIGIRYGLSRN